MNKIYVISDTHFGQWFANWFFGRPFKNLEAMNKEIINNWNKTVKDNDVIVIVGDFYSGNRLFLRSLVNSLNGEKILVKGNHDFKFRYRKLIEEKLIEVYDRLEFNYDGRKLLFTHIAEDVENDTINIHGHYHRTIRPKGLKGNHYNVCVDHNDYKPVPLEKILAHSFEIEEEKIDILELISLIRKRRVLNSAFLLTI